ncbi:MAG: phage antirepressor KilAC domain-containing protein [Oscillospiraceae bacterium]
MNNKIQIFNNSEFGELEILKNEDKFYFPATECAKILGYKNPRKAIIDHCRCVTKRDAPHPQSKTKTIKRSYIPEGDLYRLIVSSKLPSSIRFEKWVFEDILPTLRKYGIFATPEVADKIIGNPDFGISILTALKKEREEKVALSKKLEKLAPKAEYYDMILQNPASIPVTMISKDYGSSAVNFNKKLHELGIQFKMRGTWELYQKYAKNGYTHTNVFLAPNGEETPHTCWTQAGRLFLYNKLKSVGILPAIERMTADEN